MFGQFPTPKRVIQTVKLNDQAKVRLNDALTFRPTPAQIPSKDVTVSDITSLNSDMGSFMEELGQLIDSIDPSTASVPTWFWNGKDPSVDTNWSNILYHYTGFQNSIRELGTGNAINNRGAIQQLAKMLRVVNRESMVLEQISRVLVGMLGLHTDDDPSFIREQINKFRRIIKIPREGGWCVRPYLDEFVKGSATQQVQGTNGTETCHASVTGARAAEKAKIWAQKEIDTLGERKAEESIAQRMRKIFDQIQQETSLIKTLVADIRSAYAALPTLYFTEQEEGVSPQMKRDLADTWLDDVNQQGSEIKMPMEGSSEEQSSLIGPILLGLGTSVITFFVAKNRGL